MGQHRHLKRLHKTQYVHTAEIFGKRRIRIILFLETESRAVSADPTVSTAPCSGDNAYTPGILAKTHMIEVATLK